LPEGAMDSGFRRNDAEGANPVGDMLLQDARPARIRAPLVRAFLPRDFDWRITLFCYGALAPVLALFAYVRIVPIGWSVVLSFYKCTLIQPLKPYIGLTNYRLLLEDETFLLAMKNTLVYSFATVGFSTALALPLAVFLARKGRLAVVYQTIYFLPVI